MSLIGLPANVIGIYDSETLPEMTIWKESATRLQQRRKSMYKGQHRDCSAGRSDNVGGGHGCVQQTAMIHDPSDEQSVHRQERQEKERLTKQVVMWWSVWV